MVTKSNTLLKRLASCRDDIEKAHAKIDESRKEAALYLMELSNQAESGGTGDKIMDCLILEEKRRHTSVLAKLVMYDPLNVLAKIEQIEALREELENHRGETVYVTYTEKPLTLYSRGMPQLDMDITIAEYGTIAVGGEVLLVEQGRIRINTGGITMCYDVNKAVFGDSEPKRAEQNIRYLATQTYSFGERADRIIERQTTPIEEQTEKLRQRYEEIKRLDTEAMEKIAKESKMIDEARAKEATEGTVPKQIKLDGSKHLEETHT